MTAQKTRWANQAAAHGPAMNDLDFDAIAHDLELCDLGIAMTRGRLKARYVAQRARIMGAIRAANAADGLDTLTTDELMAELADG